MGKTTNILDLNNRLEKVEKENVAQNSYTSLKNKPKINGVTLTGNKSLADIGAAAAADLTTLAGDVGDKTLLNTTDKSSTVAAINEVDGNIKLLNSRVMTSGNSYVQSVAFPSRSGYCSVSLNAFIQGLGCLICDVIVEGENIVTKDRITGLSVSADAATFAYNNGVLTITFNDEATYTATFQTPYI